MDGEVVENELEVDRNKDEPSAESKYSESRNEVTKIFTNKQQWKEFVSFIKNGFKLKKEND